MTEITDSVRSFLEQGGRTGKLGYLAPDGRPLVAPIWFAPEGGRIVFNTGADSAKAAAIARDPRLTLCVDEQSAHTFVQLQGTAETTDDGDEVLRVATTVAAHYVGAEKAERVGSRIAGPGQLAVYLYPSRIVTSGDLE
ncbi:PPOX class F420-dependent oxidoreductase [Actinopolyspora mortivallis]|uniref:PPOX class F420-dependent oxidoreductase n=1 Tax=Actinopolyspora mortivallis TaxID=33906 RepID=UPI000379B672|nr:PPOX class F420-dependent oxidoreductase [Actinopolyspora mortivallis]